jgi:transposase-like protein
MTSIFAGETACATTGTPLPCIGGAGFSVQPHDILDTLFQDIPDTFRRRKFSRKWRKGMPWRRVDVLDQRLEFVVKASEPDSCIAELCREYGVSRQTGHLWLKRYQEGGARAVLEERSRRPHQSPTATQKTIVEAVRDLRRDKPDWGARKLLAVLSRKHPEWEDGVVSATTVHRILDREGLIAAADRRQAAGACQAL